MNLGDGERKREREKDAEMAKPDAATGGGRSFVWITKDNGVFLLVFVFCHTT